MSDDHTGDQKEILITLGREGNPKAKKSLPKSRGNLSKKRKGTGLGKAWSFSICRNTSTILSLRGNEIKKGKRIL